MCEGACVIFTQVNGGNTDESDKVLLFYLFLSFCKNVT